MKGLKTLTATLVASRRCWRALRRPRRARPRTATTSPAASPQNAKPAHVCQKARKKGAFFSSINADVFYTRLRQVPDRQKPLRAKPGSESRGRST